MHILLTNDDGISAPGIVSLYRALSRNHRVTVVAPTTQQSGIGHAFTYHCPLYYEKQSFDNCNEAYAVSGTPADCVKVAISLILKGNPDAVVSGMNFGENSGVSGYYSGTVAGAREGAFWRLPSYAFSLCDGADAHLDAYSEQAAQLFDTLSGLRANGAQSLTNRIYINVNFPSCSPLQTKGTRVTRQSMAYFIDSYKEVQMPDGRTGYSIFGQKHELEHSDQFDSRALENGYITISPLQFDATAEQALDDLSALDATVL